MRILIAVIFSFAAQAAWAASVLNVVATTASMGMLAREVGGAAVKVEVLAAPDRDPHMLQAKPSMMRALRDADLVVAVGAELEMGWLPAAINGAANPRLLPGHDGYFEAAAQVSLLDAGQSADRAHGDVHPAGNPHVNLDPRRMAQIARALAERLAKLEPAQTAAFRAGAQRFSAAVEQRVPGWQAQAAGSPGGVLFHKDGNYLFALLGLPILGYVEPVPGVPPTASHLNSLTAKLKGQRGVILHHAYQPAQGPQLLASRLGWKTAVVALEPAKEADAAAYFQLIDSWVTALADAK